AGGGHDRVVVDPVSGADLRDLVGHAGATSDAIDEPLGAFEDAVQDAFGGSHLPQHVHVNAAAAVGLLIGDARLMNTAADRKGDQFLVPLASRAAVIDLRNKVALCVIGIGIDSGECADAA